MSSPALQQHRTSGLVSPAKNLKVGHVMRAGLVSCQPETPVRDVAELMVTHRTHCVIVDGIRIESADGPRLVSGIVSDLDIARAVDDKDPEALTAGQIATTEMVTVESARLLREAAHLMRTHRVRQLLVVSDHSGLPVGVVSALDIAGALACGECS